MSQPALAVPAGSPYVIVPARRGTALGVFGFLVAFLGLFVPTGLIAILGLMMSLVALGKGSLAWGTMGTLVGLLGSVLWLLVMGAVLAMAGLGSGAGLVAVAGGVAMSRPEVIEVTSDMVNGAMAVVEYGDEHGELPEDLEAAGISGPGALDPWGHPYALAAVDDDPPFDIVSAGPDGLQGTEDDLTMHRLDELWEHTFEHLEGDLEALGARIERFAHAMEGHGVCGAHEAHAHIGTSGHWSYEARARADLNQPAATADSLPR